MGNYYPRSSDESLCNICSMIECSCFRIMTAQPASSHSAEQIAANHSASIGPHESGRRFGIRDGLFQAVAQGGGEQYLSAFACFSTRHHTN
jgi:hypothetical protein